MLNKGVQACTIKVYTNMYIDMLNKVVQTCTLYNKGVQTCANKSMGYGLKMYRKKVQN